ncbi:MAG TPA: nucleoside hydrolase [Acidobacteriaceae bacterium]|nr:nucleoside hydrolase [Acidobacteriaceae bacterium]
MKYLMGILVCVLLFGPAGHVWAHAQTAQVVPQKVILDTDIGDDIDDAFALGLALESPELKILQVNSDFGDTALRARLLVRYLKATGHGEIPVAVGVPTTRHGTFTQARYAERVPASDVPKRDAVDATLALIRKYPGQITLIGIGPFVNIEAMIDKDPATFAKLKCVVVMGGSIHVGYASYGVNSYTKLPGPMPEWNVLNDVAGARKLLASGVPVYMMPLDATQLKLDEVKREELFRHGSPVTDQLTLLYPEWGQLTPTLFDPMAVGYAIDPGLCRTTPMRIRVDDKGNTIPEAGTPNVNVCLKSDPEQFFDFYMPRMLAH